MKFSSSLLAFWLCFISGASLADQRTADVPKNTETDEAILRERMRQLEQIRQARAEAQRNIREAEQRLATLRAERGIQSEKTAQPWPRKVISAIKSKWTRPPIGETGAVGCTASIEVAETGDVMSVSFTSPCAPQSLKTSIEAAILKSSPLPLPDDPASFSNRITINFTPRDEAYEHHDAEDLSVGESTPRRLRVAPCEPANDARSRALEELRKKIHARAELHGSRTIFVTRCTPGVQQPYVLELLDQVLRRAENSPPSKDLAAAPNATIVTFFLDRSGRVLRVDVNPKSVGSQSASSYVVAAIKNSSPLPPFPSNMPIGYESIAITTTFTIAPGSSIDRDEP